MQRRKIVGVMGSGTSAHRELAEPLGACLARLGVHLLTGGGGGVMACVSRAFHAVDPRAGLVLGILPGTVAAEGYRAYPGYPNPWVEVAVRTHLPLSGSAGREPLSRNHINVLTSDAVVVLPGSAGTASEAALALEYGRPVVAHLDRAADLPGLPAGMRIEPTLQGVEAFLRSSLGLPGP